MDIEKMQAIAAKYGLDDVRIREGSFIGKQELILSESDYHHCAVLYERLDKDRLHYYCQVARAEIDKLKDGEME